MDRVQCDPVVGDGNVPGREAVTAHEQVSKHLDTKDTETMERELSQSVNVVFNKIQQPATDKVYYIQASIHFAFRDLVLLKTKNSETNGWISGSLEDDYNFVQEKIKSHLNSIGWVPTDNFDYDYAVHNMLSQLIRVHKHLYFAATAFKVCVDQAPHELRHSICETSNIVNCQGAPHWSMFTDYIFKSPSMKDWANKVAEFVYDVNAQKKLHFSEDEDHVQAKNGILTEDMTCRQCGFLFVKHRYKTQFVEQLQSNCEKAYAGNKKFQTCTERNRSYQAFQQSKKRRR